MAVHKLGCSHCDFNLHSRNNGGDELNFPGCLQVTSCVTGFSCVLGTIDGYVFVQSWPGAPLTLLNWCCSALIDHLECWVQPGCSQGCGSVASSFLLTQWLWYVSTGRRMPTVQQDGSWGCNKPPWECSNSANPSFTPGMNSSMLPPRSGTTSSTSWLAGSTGMSEMQRRCNSH